MPPFAKMSEYHTPVLLKESVSALIQDLNGTYVDATFGGGGHSREILQRLSNKGRLFSFDRDDDSRQNVPDDPRFIHVHHNFAFIRQFLRYFGVLPVDGILADLGISSHQINEAERGFSHRFDGPLDMRMDRDAALSAEVVVNTYNETELNRIFSTYGEISNAHKLTGAILRARAANPIKTTADLKSAIEPCTPKQTPAKFLSQVYQAIRIEVNGELKALERLLIHGTDCIKAGGKMVIISYHSLEDRMVKNFFNSGTFSGEKETDLYGNILRPFQPYPAKAIVPDDAETLANKRARSAKMRIAIKN